MKSGEEAAPERDGFLADPDNLHYVIRCVACQEDLWESKILKRSGALVISTETLPVSNEIPAFSKHIEWCPICGRRFYGKGKKGAHLYLIRDVISGIQRLI